MSQILLRFQTVTHYVTALRKVRHFGKISPARAKNSDLALSKIPVFWWILGVPSPLPLRKKSVKQYLDPFQSKNSMNHIQLNIWPLSDWGQTGEDQLNLNHFSEF